jgi:iron complex transport system substrate-binding protein
MGLRVEPIAVASLDDLGGAVARMAELAGCAEAGRALAATLTARIAAVRRAVEGRPRVRALLAVDHEPVIAAGRRTFGDDLLRAAGAENVAAGAIASYPQLGLEGLLAAAPAAIVDAAMAPGSADERAAKARAYWSRWPQLPAVRDGRVVVIDPDLVVRPGPRLVDGLERLARELHPEAFSDR